MYFSDVHAAGKMIPINSAGQNAAAPDFQFSNS